MATAAAAAVAILGMTGLVSCQSSGGKPQTVQKPDTIVAPAIGTLAIGGPLQEKGAVIGKLSGSLAGGAIGNYLERQDRDRNAAVIAAGYLPEQGEVLKVESVETSPAAARRGEIVNLTSTYTILTPKNRPMTIRETREVRYRGSLVANPFIDVQRTNGTFTSTLPITLPRSAKPGAYEVTTTVSKDQRMARSMTNFTIQ